MGMEVLDQPFAQADRSTNVCYNFLCLLHPGMCLGWKKTLQNSVLSLDNKNVHDRGVLLSLYKWGICMVITGRKMTETSREWWHPRCLFRGEWQAPTQIGFRNYCCFCLLFLYLTEATKLLNVHSWHFHHMPLAISRCHNRITWWCSGISKNLLENSFCQKETNHLI